MTAQVQINGVTTTPITCPNNGSISIIATSPAQPLLYSIISGPVTQPVQTNPVFNSLLPGSYVIKVTDGAGNEQTAPAVVGGTYSNPNFTAAVTKPYCVGESNGAITATVNPGTGTGPFTWQLIAPSPVTTAPQSSNVFSNLSSGNYTVRLTDACGSFKTSVITIAEPNTTNPFYGGAIANKVGCDTIHLQYVLLLNDVRFPLTFKYESSSGAVYTYSAATSMINSAGYLHVEQIIPGPTYGETIDITVYNACGDSTMSTIEINPFHFYPTITYYNCGTQATISYFNDPIGNYDTGIMPTATYTFTDLSTNTVIDQGSLGLTPPFDINTTYILGTTSTQVDVNKTYRFSITDGCGETFTDDVFVPGQSPPVILEQSIIHPGCIDSVVGVYRLHATGFMNGKVVLLSGPSGLGSTSPGYEYQDTYSYPDTIDNGFSGDYWFLQNLGVGTYYFKIIDDCGQELFDSIVISPQQVVSLSKEVDWEKGCLGQNKIFFGLSPEGTVTITDIATNTVIESNTFLAYFTSHQDSTLNVPAGTYAITYQYEQSAYGQSINNTLTGCWLLMDTITIDDYETPEMTTGNAIMCNNTINFVLLPDSTKGVPPYQYEVISGPQTFPVQNSNVFVINTPGTYVARIYDICGNASTKQITVDTISFGPVQASSSCNSTSLIFPSSLYYTYEWLLPNNQTYVGDSLILDPVTAADTGTYYISKIININGCVDTLHTTYHVTLPNFLTQTIQFCQGTAVTVGSHTYTIPGNYSDTLVTAAGCDSIVVTHLAILPQNMDTTQVTICTGDSLQVGGQNYGISGLYVDSTQNTAGCYDLHFTDLLVHDLIDTVNVSICTGGSYLFGGTSYQSPGYYSDTLVSSAGCDSVSVLHLTVLPYIQHALSVTICQDDHYAFGGIQLNQPGIYIDTLPTSGCDSIVTLTLAVSPFKFNTFIQSICQGDTLFIGNNAYTTPGTHTDTLSTATCDSIVTVTLTVLPLKSTEIYATICAGENYPFGGTHYIYSGNYVQVYPTSTCDSTVTLHLTVNPLPAVHITSNAYETADGIFVQLNAISSSSPLSYQWTSSDTLSNYTIANPTSTIQVPTWVYVTVTDANGCTATASYHIGIPVTSTLYIPNSFTPNGDEANQLFRIYGTNIAQFKLEIYDRWGELIFETTDINYGWDATYQGRMVQDGTYVYKVLAVGMDYVTYDKTGHVTVLK